MNETQGIRKSEMRGIRDTVVAIVRDASALVLKHYERLDPRQTRDKGLNDLVTPVDNEVELFLREQLSAIYPDFGFVGEETGGTVDADSIFWVVDPLDGTTNYAHGFPYFCISVALNNGPVTMLGVVYDPLRDEMSEAIQGEGAFRNGARLTIAPRNTLVSALIASGFPNRAIGVLPRYEAISHRFLRAGAGIRRTGSAALDLANIAAGRLDGTFQFGISLWDYAAGALLVTEAGGKVFVSPNTGNPLSQCDIFAGSDFVVNQMLSFDNLEASDRD